MDLVNLTICSKPICGGILGTLGSTTTSSTAGLSADNTSSQAAAMSSGLSTLTPFKPSISAYRAYGNSGNSCETSNSGFPERIRCSQVTIFKSPLFKTRTTNRGSAQSFQCFEIVIRPFMPSICIAPSPTSAIDTLSGKANLAAIVYGTPGHMVASVPESDAFMPSRIFKLRANQLADDPESAVRIQLSGSFGDSSQ